MAKQLGLCGFCGLTKECSVADQGFVCGECWKAMADNPIRAKNRVVIPPDPGVMVHVLMDGNDYLTIDGTLYGFARREDAEHTLETIKEEMDLPDVTIQEIEAIHPFNYALRVGTIRMLAVKQLVQQEDS
jgi:hypothetical protein